MPSSAHAPISNINPLNNIGFNVIIKKLPSTTFFATAVQLPGISTSSPKMPNMFHAIPQPPDSAHLDILSLDFIVDEDLTNWLEIYSWLVGMTFPQSHDQWKSLVGPAGGLNNVYSDVKIQTLTSAKNPNKEFTFHDCMPKSLTGIKLIGHGNDVESIVATVDFDFSYFEVSCLRS